MYKNIYVIDFNLIANKWQQICIDKKVKFYTQLFVSSCLFLPKLMKNYKLQKEKIGIW